MLVPTLGSLNVCRSHGLLMARHCLGASPTTSSVSGLLLLKIPHGKLCEGGRAEHPLCIVFPLPVISIHYDLIFARHDGARIKAGTG